MRRGLPGIPNKIPWTKPAVSDIISLKRPSYLMLHTILGGNLNAASRQALMQKLARIEPSSARTPAVYVPSISVC
jgi:hypothetical protein